MYVMQPKYSTCTAQIQHMYGCKPIQHMYRCNPILHLCRCTPYSMDRLPLNTAHVQVPTPYSSCSGCNPIQHMYRLPTPIQHMYRLKLNTAREQVATQCRTFTRRNHYKFRNSWNRLAYLEGRDAALAEVHPKCV